MSWKKGLVIFVVVVFGFVFLAAAALGTIAVAGLAGLAAIADDTVVESVVDSVEEVARNVEQLEITVDVPEVIITDPDSGRSQVIVPRLPGESGRIIIDGLPGENSRFFSNDAPFKDGGPFEEGFSFEGRFPFEEGLTFDGGRVVVNARDRFVFGPHFVLNQVGNFIRGAVTMLGLILVALGAWLLLKKNRQPTVKDKVDTI